MEPPRIDGLYSYALVLTRSHAESEDFGTGNIRSRHAGHGKAVTGQQYEGLAIYHPQKCLAQSVENAAK